MILDKLKAKFTKPNTELGKTIAEIGLSTRTYHRLRRADIWTVGDLVQLSWNDLAGFRRMNRKGIEEVERVLKGMGLGLGLREDDK